MDCGQSAGEATASQYTYRLGASRSRLRLNEGGQVMVALHNHSDPPHARKRLLSLYNQGTPPFTSMESGTLPHPHTNEKVFLVCRNFFLSWAVALTVPFIFLFYMSLGGKAGLKQID